MTRWQWLTAPLAPWKRKQKESEWKTGLEEDRNGELGEFYFGIAKNVRRDLEVVDAVWGRRSELKKDWDVDEKSKAVGDAGLSEVVGEAEEAD